MAAVTHHALPIALAREPPLETIPASRPQSPAPTSQPALASPFMDQSDLFKTLHSTPRLLPAFQPSEHRRPRPAPITIPQNDSSQPPLLSYPLAGGGGQGGQQTSGKGSQQSSGKGSQQSSGQGPQQNTHHGRSVAVRKSSLSSASRPIVPPPSAENPLCDPNATIRMTSSPNSTASVTRHRSLSTLGLVKRAQDRSARFGKPGSPTNLGHKRRSSLGSGEFDIARWREMGSAAQFDRTLPYGYGRSDLGLDAPVAPSANELPPLAIDTQSAFIALEKLKIARDEVPTRSSSLLYDSSAVLPDNVSIVSMSDPSMSSPSIMSKSLPSTKTSLSRSVRSGKEGDETEGHSTETAQVLLDKRRMILLEIVETEISYVHALRALVHIYLPQLAVLPQLSSRSHCLVARNATELLEFHTHFAASMVDVLKGTGVGYNCCQVEILDSVTQQLAELFVRESANFDLYNDYCAGSMPAMAVLRDVADRIDYEVFEKRCQYISSATAQACLKEILNCETPQPSRIRLRFKDILIAPIQRVCRYPLLLGSLLADVHRDSPPTGTLSSVESGLAVMRNVAENADDARQRKEAELKTAAVLERIESNNVLSPLLLKQLGTCRLIGALDVLYRQSAHVALDKPAKVKYLAAFLFRGYLLLAKPKRNKFDVRHYLPLEVLEIIDIKEGCLPFCIRLAIRDHTFDMALTCEAEKELWATELSAARDESTIPPFELPSSVSLFAPRSRHGSTNSRVELQRQRTPSKRYSMLNMEASPNKRYSALPTESLSDKRATVFEDADVTASPDGSPVEVLNDWDYRSQPSAVFLQRPSLTTRLQIDRALSDVVSESLATARSKTQLQHHVVPDRRSTLLEPRLRRRRSIAETCPVDVITAREVRGAVINGDRPRSLARARSFIMDGGPMDATEMSRNSSFSSVTEEALRHSQVLVKSASGVDLPSRAPRADVSDRSRSRHRRAMSTSGIQRAQSVPPCGIEVLTSSTSDSQIVQESAKQAQDSTEGQVIQSPSHTTRKSKSIRRSLSFFSRKSSSDEADDFDSVQDTPLPTSQGSTTPPQLRSAPNTPNLSPQTPKRRRSVRILGSLRGFTPI